MKLANLKFSKVFPQNWNLSILLLLLIISLLSSCEKTGLTLDDGQIDPSIEKRKAAPPECFEPTTCDCVESELYPTSGTISFSSIILGFLYQRATDCWEEMDDCPDIGICHPVTVTEPNLICDFDVPNFALFRTGVPIANNDNVTGMVCLIESFIEENRPDYPWSPGYYVKEIDFFISEFPCGLLFSDCVHECGVCLDPSQNIVRRLGVQVVYAECTPAGCQ